MPKSEPPLRHYVPSFLLAIFFIATGIHTANGHGRLIEPPSRASMWRYGFNTPPNYNDHELYCGGFTKQWQINGGKCGVCGDPWDAPQPRPHEGGGKYGQGIIVRKYKVGTPFTIRIEVTANHRGYFEFRLCPNNAPKRPVTQQCLDKYVLRRARQTVKDPDEVFHETRYYPATENKVYEMRYMLPPGITCTQCVLQWKYIAGNNWGMCPNGTGAVGCGPQEEFRACADIAIYDSAGGADERPQEETTKKIPTTQITPESSSVPTEETTPGVHENEIPDNTYKEEHTKNRDYFIFMSSIALLSLALVLSVLILVYVYYYHAGNVVEQWSKTDFRLKGASCWSAFKQKIHSCSSSNEKNEQFEEKPPVPPPRTKRHSIGFKGVPENLV